MAARAPRMSFSSGNTASAGDGNRTNTQVQNQARNPMINQYAARMKGDGVIIAGLHNDTMNFGSYMPDSDAQENVRNFYETLEAVGQTQEEGTGIKNIRRVAPISDRELDLVRQAKEANLKMKNDQYWTSQIDPALPWTLTEVTKVRPDILEKRLNAIKQLSQYTLDYEILRHLGHGGDPRLAELQYMIDQGQMDHMPRSTLVEEATRKFQTSNFSIWNAFSSGSDRTGGDKFFSDNHLSLARTRIDKRFDNVSGPYMRPTLERSLAETLTGYAPRRPG
jgi:hypothetical protein